MAEGDQSSGVFNLTELPEDCLTKVISLTSPEDACRLALVATWLRSAADSDPVWKKFLPADHREILGRSEEGIELLRSSISKKHLYRYLCKNPLLIDGGTKSFSIDKSTGNKSFVLGAKTLAISWIEEPMYWNFIALPESRFGSAAELIAVCWLEINGAINPRMLSPGTRYGAYLVYKMATHFWGFDRPPFAEASVGLMGREEEWMKVEVDLQPGAMSLEREDGWLEVELGEVLITGEEDDNADLMIQVAEVKAGWWKRGLIVEGIEIRMKPLQNI